MSIADSFLDKLRESRARDLYKKNFKLFPTTKFLLGWNITFQVTANNIQVDNSTATYASTATNAPPPNYLYGITNSVYPVNNPQTIGGFILRSCVMRTQGTVSSYCTWCALIVRVTQGSTTNHPALSSASLTGASQSSVISNTVVTLYKPEENVIFADTGIVLNNLVSHNVSYVVDSPEEAFIMRQKRSLNANEGLGAIFAFTNSSTTESAGNIMWNAIMQFFMKNNTE